ncbi:hypothetical protein ABT095_06810 [Kitasatospora sp. NPDC002227]|uniref:hypothetical protein n=1 Tax=Kitasatospora sp. NPDC002227 TaxID=3154773 RepID=UPI00331EECA4
MWPVLITTPDEAVVWQTTAGELCFGVMHMIGAVEPDNLRGITCRLTALVPTGPDPAVAVVLPSTRVGDQNWVTLVAAEGEEVRRVACGSSQVGVAGEGPYPGDDSGTSLSHAAALRGPGGRRVDLYSYVTPWPVSGTVQVDTDVAPGLGLGGPVAVGGTGDGHCSG